MIPYKNINRKSGIESYETTENSIHVKFFSGRYKNYLYDSNRPGIRQVNEMKLLAYQGYGLNSYIIKNIKSSFSKKW
jgi:hypothetical protein